MSAAALSLQSTVPGVGLQAVPLADRDRRDAMKLAWKAYHGELPDPLTVEKDQPNDNVKPNRCATIVDKGVSWLFGKPLKIEVVGLSDEAQNYLDAVWKYDDFRMTLLAKVALNGAVCGQAFLKIIPANPRANLKYPRFVVLDPSIVRVVTAPDDCELILAYIIEYSLPNVVGTTHKRQVIARVDPDNLAGYTDEFDLDDSWTITNYVSKDGQTWTQQGEIDTSWSWPFPPIISCQNLPNPNEYWGIPDLTPDLIGMNKAINFSESNTSRIIKYHGHPKTWVTGVDARNIAWSIDGVLCLPSPESKIGNLEPVANLAALLSFVENLRSDMDERSRVPAVALGRLMDLPKGNISGVALQLLFQPLIEKTSTKQRLYGDLVRQASRAALVMGGYCSADAWEECQVNLPWQNLLPIDDLAAAQTAIALLQIGVSQQTLQSELGYNADEEAEKVEETAQRSQTAFMRGQGPAPALVPPGAQMQDGLPQPPAPGG